MGIEIALAVSAAAAAASTGVAIANYEASKDAAGAERDLANQQAAHLQNEQRIAAEQAAAQATTGSSFGFTSESPKTLASGFGFGSAPGGSPNSGRAQITGLG